MERLLDDALANVANRENSAAFLHSSLGTQSCTRSTKFMIICPYFSRHSRNNSPSLSPSLSLSSVTPFTRYRRRLEGRHRVGLYCGYIDNVNASLVVVITPRYREKKTRTTGTKRGSRCNSKPSRIRLFFSCSFTPCSQLVRSPLKVASLRILFPIPSSGCLNTVSKDI